MYNRVRYNRVRYNRSVITSTLPSPDTDLESAIVAALKDSDDLEVICGDRIYPSRIPQQATLPALAYQVSQSDRVMHLRGAGGLRRVAVEFECRSPVKSDNRDVREIVRKLFQGLIGHLGNVKIKYVSLDEERDTYEQPMQGQDDGIYLKTFAFTFVVRETVPKNTVNPALATQRVSLFDTTPPGDPELEPSIVEALKDSTALEALCQDRVYPSRIPQKAALPALSYEVSQADRVTHLGGAGGLRRVSVEFECRSLVKSDNVEIREVIRELFQGFIGMLGSMSIKYISLDQESDMFDEPTPGSDDGTYSKTFSFTFVVRESVPVHV